MLLHFTPDQLPRPHPQPKEGWTPPAVSLTALLDLLTALAPAATFAIDAAYAAKERNRA